MKKLLKPLLGVDTIELFVRGEGMILRNKGHSNYYKPDGSMGWSGENRVTYPGKFQAHGLSVRTTDGGTKLEVSGSGYGFRYGQNVLTPADVRYAARKMLQAVQRRTNLKPSTARESWSDCEIEMERADLYLLYQYETDEQAYDLITQVKRQTAAMDINAKMRKGYVLISPQDGRETALRCYGKRAQEKAVGTCSSKEIRDEMDKFLVGVLRVEIQFRRQILIAEGLSRACDWTIEKAYSLFDKHFKSFGLLNAIDISTVTCPELEKLPKALRRAAWLASVPADRDFLYGTATWKKLNYQLRKYGWDTRLPWSPGITTVKLADALDYSNALAEVPDWFVEHGLYPED